MNWMDNFIENTLEKVPEGRYRKRAEAELRDHLETQCRALTEAGLPPEEVQTETLRAMGEPEKLQGEYEAAWRRTLEGRMNALGHRLEPWVLGCAVMGGVHFLIYAAVGTAFNLAISLPGDSQDPWVRLIRGTVGDINNSLFWRHLFPLVLALAAGGFYLSRRFQGARHRVWKISMGLSFHWAYIVAYMTMWQAIDDHHLPFWEAAVRDFLYVAWYHALTLLLCILLGVVFAQLGNRKLQTA